MGLPKADRRLEAHLGQVLLPGERLVAAGRALVIGSFEGRLGVFGEVLTGAVMQSLLMGESVKRAHRAGFPAAPSMLIGMTDRRFLVWKSSVLRHKPVRFLGDIPFERLASVIVQPEVDKRRVTFGFVDAAPVSVTAFKRDRPERFAENFRRTVPVTEAPLSTMYSTEMTARAPGEVGVGEPGSRELAPAMAGAALGADAGAVGTALPPPLPPPPPAVPARGGRPAGNSWARALPLPGSPGVPSSSEPQSKDRRCIQCGSTNPADAAFCWRCFVPFVEPSLPKPATVLAMPPAAPATASAAPRGALDGAVKPTLSWGALPAKIDGVSHRNLITKLVAVALAVVVGLVAYGGAQAAWARYTRKHVIAPNLIAGMGRIDNPQLSPYTKQLETLAQQNGLKGKAAFYGFSGAARFFFAAFEYQRDDQNPDDIFTEFAKGYSTAGKAKIDMKTKTSDVSEEATYICARVTGKLKGSICMWTDRDVVGFVHTIRQGVRTTHDLTAVVRFSVES